MHTDSVFAPTMAGRRHTLRDIAKRAGVSVSTVSRVLNDQRGISPATRKRVLEAVQALGYSPNAAARSLITRRTGTVGFVAHRGDVPSHFITASHPLVGIEQECQRWGYHVITTFVSDETMRSNRLLPMLEQERVDGLILVGPNLRPSFILDLYTHGIPIVLFDNKLQETELDCVLYENENSTYFLTRHLIDEHDHRQIAFLSGPPSWVSSRERAAGYRRAILEAGLSPLILSMPDTTFETGYTAMRELLRTHPEISGVVAVNDAVAMGAIAACREAGRTVPGDIAVTGFDDVRFAAHHTPPLTTVHTYGEEMGRLAARRLLERLEHQSAEEAHVQVCLRVGTKPMIRESCGCASGSGSGHSESLERR